MNSRLLEEVRHLGVEEQLELVETVWDELGSRDAIPPPTHARKEELDRRLADHRANPDDVVSWNDVKASALERIRQ